MVKIGTIVDNRWNGVFVVVVIIVIVIVFVVVVLTVVVVDPVTYHQRIVKIDSGTAEISLILSLQWWWVGGCVRYLFHVKPKFKLNGVGVVAKM